jgi:hypothetical protein
MKRYLYRMTSRYVPPGVDVDVTCFIAEKAKHFNIDPSPWRKLARTVNSVSIRGTHRSILGCRARLTGEGTCGRIEGGASALCKLKKTGRHDDERINVEQDHEARYWLRSLAYRESSYGRPFGLPAR